MSNPIKVGDTNSSPNTLTSNGIVIKTPFQRRQHFAQVVCLTIFVTLLSTTIISWIFSIFVSWELWSVSAVGASAITIAAFFGWRVAKTGKSYLAGCISIGTLTIALIVLYWQAPYFAFYLVMLFLVIVSQLVLGLKETLGIGSLLFINTLVYSIVNHNQFFAPDGQLVIVDYGTFAIWWVLIGGIAQLVGYLYNTVIVDNQLLNLQTSKLIETQKQLLESETRYRGLSQASFEGIVIRDQSQILEINQTLTEMLGYTSTEIVGKALAKYVEFPSQLLANASPQTMWEDSTVNQAVAIRKDGSRFPIETQSRKFVYKDQEVRVNTIRDITLRKQTEDQLLQYTQRIQTLAKLSQLLAEVSQDYAKVLDTIATQIAEVLGDGCSIALISADGEQLEVVAIHHRNPEMVQAYLQMLKLSPLHPSEGNLGQVISTGQALLQPEVSLEQVLATIKPEFWPLATQFRIYSRVIVPLKAQGQIIGALVLSRYQPGHSYTLEDQLFLQDLADRAALAIANAKLYLDLAKELAERKITEAALQQKEEQLRQAQRLESIGRLAGGVAHDFNNLLTIIINYSQFALLELQVVKTNLKLADVQQSIEQIQRAAEQAAELTRQLLAFSRKTILQPKVLNLNQVVDEISKMVGRLIEENIIFTTHTDPQLGQIEADPRQLEQVLMNLLMNARDAMPLGGKLTIETTNAELDEEYVRSHVGTKSGAYVLLSVSDTGQGMDAETLLHIFDPFFTTKELGKGTGLGLATVYGIVKQSGGNIWVYSEVGLGSTFKIYLPRLEQPARLYLNTPDPTTTMVTREGRETILLVEDAIGVRLVAKRMLEEHGYTVLEASNGIEALEICLRHQEQPSLEGEDYGENGKPIHLLVTDIMMQGMQGQEVAAQVKKYYPAIKVLYMSGYSDLAIVQAGLLEAGAAFLEKPFTLKGLVQKVRESLSKKSE